MAKATVVRKSLGPKRPCGFDSRPGHKNTSSRYLEGVFFVIWQTFGKHLFAFARLVYALFLSSLILFCFCINHIWPVREHLENPQ